MPDLGQLGTHAHRGAQRFLYEEVSRELRVQIQGGVLEPGVKIPSHKTLGQQFGVSAITVRRAIRDLILEGLLLSRQGLGVFVRDRRRIVRSLGTASTTPFADEIRRAGVVPGIQQLSFSLVPARASTARRLGLDEGTYVYRHEKIILGDGQPLSRETTYLPREVGQFLEEELKESFVFSLLTLHGFKIDHIDFRINGVAASESDAQLFNLSVGFPLIVVHYVLLSPIGEPIAAGSIISRSDRMAFDFCSRPEKHKAAVNFD